GLREAEVTDLAGAHQLRHRPDRLLDRYAGVYAVLVVQVDVIDAEPRERGVAGLAHVLRAAVHADKRPVRFPDVAELGGQYDVVAPIPDGAADELLVGERTVDVGGIVAEDRGRMDVAARDLRVRRQDRRGALEGPVPDGGLDERRPGIAHGFAGCRNRRSSSSDMM